MPDKHQVTQGPKPTRHPSKVIAGWCYGDRGFIQLTQSFQKLLEQVAVYQLIKYL